MTNCKRSTRTAQGPFQQPPGVSFEQEPHPEGAAYVFRHRELGVLGRIVLRDVAGKRCQITCEVAGHPDDPMTKRRAAIFKPLGMDLTRCLDMETGGTGQHTLAAPSSWGYEHQEVVESKLMQCERCGQNVAMLIFAPEATDQGRCEDYARKMYAQVAEVNVDTYVIGPALGDGPLERVADIWKIWPERESVRRLRPAEFNLIVDELVRAHCS